jgi:hypothetical protein
MGRVGTERPGATAIEYGLPWGTVIRGQRWGAAPDRVLLVHEHGTDIDAWGALPARLAQEVLIGVAAFELPGHGLADDPWEPDRLGDVLRALVGRAELPFRQVLITAGLTAGAALDIASELQRVGLVCLSPETSPGAMAPPRSPETPKLFFASALIGAELDNARTLASNSGGWATVTSLAVAETGTAILASRWSEQVEEGIVSFARDFLGLRAPSRRLVQAVEDARHHSDSP